METTLTEVLSNMRPELVDEFTRETKNRADLSEADKVSLAKKIQSRSQQKLQEGIYMGTPLSSDDHRTKAKAHQGRADELKAGEKKDLNTAAADAHTKAATAIDKANASSAKAELLN
jgi:hypothetical protein